MTEKSKTKKELLEENEELRLRLEEAEETLNAIRGGEVDALMVSGPGGEQVFTLKGAEQPYRIVVDSMNEGAITFTAEGVVLYCNERFSGMVKVPSEKIVGSELHNFFPESARKSLDELVAESFHQRTTGELALKSGEGTLYVLFSAKPLQTDNAGTSSAIITDISDLRLAAMELKKVHETLEQRVTERTAELKAANAALRHSSRATLNMMEDALAAQQQAEEASVNMQAEVTMRMEAEKQIKALNEQLKLRIDELMSANKEMESFSYSVSHDLRAPLRHLTGFAELLKKRAGEELDEKSREYVDFISEAAVQMGKLIDDLLAFSRTGRVEMMRQQMHLDVMVRGVIRSLSSEAAGRDVEWRIGGLPDVSGDPALLKLVWMNLISNALKFTRPKNHAIIEIGSRDEGREYVFYVKDNGVGFDMKFKDKLFSIFQRLHSPAEFEGTGVGLANVHRIITRHGGKVWAEGEEGEGAMFYFTLPK